MTLNKQHIVIITACVLGFLALFIGLFISQHNLLSKNTDASQIHGTYLASSRAIKPFSFQATDNNSFNNESLKGHWTFIFFGFTNCGYLCPTTMAELGKMYKLLEAKHVKNLPHVVMISIDPDRDNVTKLKNYVQAFHPNFYGARGEENAINTMSRELGIAYEKVVKQGGDDNSNYDVQHSGTILLFNPEGELQVFFTSPHQAPLLAKDYMTLIA